jgi:predicted ester cyclase
MKKGVFPMSTDDNKAFARRLIEEAWNQGNLATVDELMAPDHIGHHSLVPKQPPSREFYKQYIVRTRTAFPDFQATIEEQIAEGDLVVTRWSAQGTHQGVFRRLCI